MFGRQIVNAFWRGSSRQLSRELQSLYISGGNAPWCQTLVGSALLAKLEQPKRGVATLCAILHCHDLLLRRQPLPVASFLLQAPHRKEYASSSIAREVISQLQSMQDLTALQSRDPAAIASFFSKFDAEAFLLHSGPIKRYKEAAREAGLAHAFADAASSPGTSLDGCINLVASLTLLGDFDVPLIHATVRRAVPELDQMKPDRIAALCYTLGTAGYSNYAFLKAVENTMQRRKDDFNMLSLAKVVWMLGRVHYNNEQVAGLVEYLIGRALLCESPQDVLYAMWASGAHDERNQDLVEHACQLLPAHLSSFKGGELAKLAWGLVQQDVGNEHIFEEIARVSAREEVIQGMYPRDLAKLTWSLGQRGVGGAVMAKPLGALVQRHIEYFNRNELEMILSAFNNWGIHDGTAVLISEQMGRTHS